MTERNRADHDQQYFTKDCLMGLNSFRLPHGPVTSHPVFLPLSACFKHTTEQNRGQQSRAFLSESPAVFV